MKIHSNLLSGNKAADVAIESFRNRKSILQGNKTWNNFSCGKGLPSPLTKNILCEENKSIRIPKGGKTLKEWKTLKGASQWDLYF